MLDRDGGGRRRGLGGVAGTGFDAAATVDVLTFHGDSLRGEQAAESAGTRGPRRDARDAGPRGAQGVPGELLRGVDRAGFQVLRFVDAAAGREVQPDLGPLGGGDDPEATGPYWHGDRRTERCAIGITYRRHL